ncbi:hypothetical protein ASD11_01200 [Aeromicrobium sp. Root495]|uniref:hypothetical protein n=1 Tax=Aeromicrobium sp. Root495 TaxID=1736550 RepID=UPI0006FAE132|nr:hypothetical protein [Aeromicrobium sp. Root495]KQY58312.1 hypothetical protein ASD11_01200 [Aeromicrobium sp. Root495]
MSEGSDESMSEEWHLLRLMEFRLRALEYHQVKDKGTKPEILPTPSALTEQLEAAAQQQARHDLARERHIARVQAKGHTS